MMKRTLLLGLPTLLSLALVACGPDPADPKSPEQVLLDHAVEALWGKVDPASVKALRTTSTLTETQDGFSSVFDMETLQVAGQGSQEIRRWQDFDIREDVVHSKDSSWHLVDGTVVELQKSQEDETGQGQQSWLFEISKLDVLKDTERFKLSHRGELTNAGGLKVERLEIRDRNRPGVTLTLDFSTETWLITEVTMESEGNKSLTIQLSDYRDIDGVQFAHKIDAIRDGKPHAQQRNITYEVNPEYAADLFSPPLDLNRDAILTKKSIGGTFATAMHGGPEDEISETVDALREWIADNRLEISGPLVVIRNLESKLEATAEPVKPRIAIAVRKPAKSAPALEESETFRLADLASGPALCLNQIGTRTFADILQQIESHKGEARLKKDAPALEVYFSPEGTIRQIQVLVQ